MSCLHGCEGMYVNAYTKMPFTEEELSFITEVQHDYDKYKLHQKLWPIDLKGIQRIVRKIIVKEYSLKDYTWNTNLKMIRISINAPVFTRITKDTRIFIIFRYWRILLYYSLYFFSYF